MAKLAKAEHVRKLEGKLIDSFLNDASKKSRRTLGTDEDGVRVVTVHISGFTVGLALAIEIATGEKDAMARVLNEMNETVEV